MINRAARGRAVGVFDATAGRAAIAVAGPHSRELMTRVSPDDWSNEAQGYGWAREVEVDDGHALCLRVSLVGELGYVLYPTADQAVNVYDALVTAGRDLGLLDPYTAGLGSLVALDKPGGFVGRDAVENCGSGRTSGALSMLRCAIRSRYSWTPSRSTLTTRSWAA